MIHLNAYGWNEKLSRLKRESTYSALPHGRIAIVHRTCYEIVAENGVFQCELRGNMMYEKPAFELPCTGDWVIFQPFDETKGIIVDVLPHERPCTARKAERFPTGRPSPLTWTRHSLSRAWMIISISAEPSVSWFRYWKRESNPYWC